MRASFHEDGLDMLFIAIFKLALEIATTMLVFAKLIEIATVRLKWDIVEASLISMVATAGSRALKLSIVGTVDVVHALALAICLDRSTHGSRRVHLADVVGLHVVCVWLRCHSGSWAAHRSHRVVRSRGVGGTEWCSTCVKVGNRRCQVA